MSKRHNSRERVGIYRIGTIVEEDFEWVFREQPIVDVGIDALIEKSDKGNPTGNFIALQIKSGASTVHASKKGKEYIYYMSNVHYYYWINLDVPVLLVCHIPENKRNYWVEVNKANSTKTLKGWKISLPHKNIFSLKSYAAINRVMISGKFKSLSLNSINNKSVYNLGHLDLVNDSIFTLTQITNTYTVRINTITLRLNEIILQEDSPVRKAMVEIEKFTLVTSFETLASRLYNEINIFSQTYSKAIIAIKSNYILLIAQGETKSVSNQLRAISKMVDAFSDAMNGMESMRISIEKLQSDIILHDNTSMEKAEIAVSSVILNLTQAEKLGRELLSETENLISK
jgi:hypothetical protein